MGVAVERRGEEGFGRCRLQVIADVSAATLTQFLADHVEPGSRVLTDGWTAHGPATANGYTHERCVAPGQLVHELLPGVHGSSVWPSGGCSAPTREPSRSDRLQSYRRVHIPVQSASLALARLDLLPAARTGGGSSPDPLPRHRGEPPVPDWPRHLVHQAEEATLPVSIRQQQPVLGASRNSKPQHLGGTPVSWRALIYYITYTAAPAVSCGRCGISPTNPAPPLHLYSHRVPYQPVSQRVSHVRHGRSGMSGLLF